MAIENWEPCKRRLIAARGALLNAVGERPEEIFDQICRDWTKVRAAGMRKIVDIPVAPVTFNPANYPSLRGMEMEISKCLQECHRALGDLKRVYRTLLLRERQNVDWEDLTPEEKKIIQDH